MVQGRQFGHAYLLGSLLLLAAFLHPATAYSAPGDPPSGSPAGAVYQLPLEQGRSDAAPKGSGGTAVGGSNAAGGATGGSGSAAEPSQPGSLYRSENNFGSSSQVPGVATAGARAAGDSGGAAGGGDSGAGGGAIAAGAVVAQSGDNGNTSVAGGVVLIGAIALLAIAVGIASRRFSQR